MATGASVARRGKIPWFSKKQRSKTHLDEKVKDSVARKFFLFASAGFHRLLFGWLENAVEKECRLSIAPRLCS